MTREKNPNTAVVDTLAEPYPILRRFTHRIVPILVLFITIMVLTTALASRTAFERIYLRLATIRAEGIAEGVKRIAPDSWARLLSGRPLTAADLAALDNAFEDERQEFNISRLKVYDLDRRTIFSENPNKIGQREDGAGLNSVLETGKAVIISKPGRNDQPFYELYVPLIIEGRIRTVFELYEPMTFLDEILAQTVRPVVLYPGLLFIVLIVSLAIIVRHAQHDIDHRTRTINRLRERLESLVSRSAVSAVRRAGAAADIPSEQVACTLFYSDIRRFTSYSERHSPRQVIEFLNDIIGLQVEIVHGCGGDVDKMIGDAVLARFQGPDKAANAVRAAIRIQEALVAGTYPRGIGIGLFSGSVIAGGIGPEDRRDYTIIGDAVNVAARLCTLAEAGEVVVDADTLARAGTDGFGPVQSVSVKGRDGLLNVHKKTVVDSTPVT